MSREARIDSGSPKGAKGLLKYTLFTQNEPNFAVFGLDIGIWRKNEAKRTQFSRRGAVPGIPVVALCLIMRNKANYLRFWSENEDLALKTKPIWLGWSGLRDTSGPVRAVWDLTWVGGPID